MDLKTQEINGQSSQKTNAWGVPQRSKAARILFLTAFSIGFLRFRVIFSCSDWVLKSDSIPGHVWSQSHELIQSKE